MVAMFFERSGSGRVNLRQSSGGGLAFVACLLQRCLCLVGGRYVSRRARHYKVFGTTPAWERFPAYELVRVRGSEGCPFVQA